MKTRIRIALVSMLALWTLVPPLAHAQHAPSPAGIIRSGDEADAPDKSASSSKAKRKRTDRHARSMHVPHAGSTAKQTPDAALSKPKRTRTEQARSDRARTDPARRVPRDSERERTEAREQPRTVVRKQDGSLMAAMRRWNADPAAGGNASAIPRAADRFPLVPLDDNARWNDPAWTRGPFASPARSDPGKSVGVPGSAQAGERSDRTPFDARAYRREDHEAARRLQAGAKYADPHALTTEPEAPGEGPASADRYRRGEEPRSRRTEAADDRRAGEAYGLVDRDDAYPGDVQRRREARSYQNVGPDQKPWRRRDPWDRPLPRTWDPGNFAMRGEGYR